ncbi:YihA family ribosome biogenesis GTP-binding protein [Streptobacillus moniliformis]|uniref:Probable GTP-binding protein EngB n=1 Tax=Streptobacillus moniliformis (strain ATCC 14647 / DSM 12112 / NCTC 10651 / 9901) TaxID=519441 RepID=D1AWT3_STRM9|nr:ribosome biogenesis GTP-binding protein YihA/YsxC [Streptobacillus moniliformis]ACZ00759.1 GTP-binding protein HSR1-related protein [Streptobacillus moniliformis DSM 12112]AVL42846.1 YihA family ribosome biogenesis GTP-binding protein [Streptobacillus moniliformis]SQA14111.1 Probable GTP-binding protein EngB [Streptobacillus moniliformis]
MEIKSAEYSKSCIKLSDYPEKMNNTEIAFVGRSNVGKSSLINTIVKRNNLARTSKTPGRTQLVNFFLVNKDRYFVDLPGYGFAKVPANIKKNWGNIISEYLNSERKKVVFVLLDIRRVPSGEDIEMLEYLEHYNIEYYIIFTKCDKLSNNEKFRQLKEIKKKLEFSNEDVFFHSSLKNIGTAEILDFIDKL